MNLKKEFNRLNGLLGDRYDGMHDATEELSERMRQRTLALAERAREGLDHSRGTLITAEETVERHLRDHSGVYLAAGLVLLGLMLSRTMAPRRSTPERDW